MWKIFYDDGSSFSNEDGEPEDAPGVGAVVIADSVANYTAHRWDWYYWRPSKGEWWGADIHGLLYQLCKNPRDTLAVKQGGMVTTQFYQKCMRDAFQARTSTPGLGDGSKPGDEDV